MFLVLHILTAVLDTFAPISLLAAFVPFVSSYRPFWLGLGAVAFDLLLAVTLTSLLRTRLGPGVWRATHWLAYACWPFALLHTLGTGSDVRTTWLLVLSVACLAFVARRRARAHTQFLDRGARARARPRAREHRCLHRGPAAVAALRAARHRMGAALRDARVAAGPLLHGPLLLPHRGEPVSGYGSLAERSAVPAGPDGPPAGLPRLLAGIPARGALSLGAHLALHGALPAGLASPPARGRRGSSGLIDLVDAAGLRGCGGAGYPLATKLRAVAGATRSPLGGRPVVVVNGAEGEPASAKDRTLLRSLPHLVLDGALLAAGAVGAHEILLGVCASDPAALDACALALAERGTPRRGAPTVQLVAVPARYVAGQESALVSFLSGGPALPTFTPPRPFERGVRGRPTLVSNVETLAHLALLARHGSEWFRELGTPTQPGSALVTLSGPVAFPGVYEIEHGSPLLALLDAAEGPTAPLRAVLLGGYCGTWLDASLLRSVALSDEHLAPHGATLGAGVVVLLSTAACPVAELARLVRWLASESARQCGPCVFGLDALACAFESLVLGDAPGGQGAVSRIATLAGLVNRRGACAHPDGAARLVASALDVFAEELADHARHGPCAACARPSELPRPRVGGGGGGAAHSFGGASARRESSERRLASPSRR